MKLPAARSRQTGSTGTTGTTVVSSGGETAVKSTGSLSELVILSKAIDAEDRKSMTEAIPLYKMFLAKSLPTSYVAQRTMAETKVREHNGGTDE